MKTYRLVSFGLILVSATAFADSHLSLVGGTDYNLNSETATIGTGTMKGGLGIAGGAMLSVDRFEFGGIYISKKFTTSAPGVPDQSTKINYIQIPALVRLGRGSVTFGLGGFYDVPVTSGVDANYGLTGGPRIGKEFFLDVRFNYGLKSGHSEDLLAEVGLSFGKDR